MVIVFWTNINTEFVLQMDKETFYCHKENNYISE